MSSAKPQRENSPKLTPPEDDCSQKPIVLEDVAAHESAFQTKSTVPNSFSSDNHQDSAQECHQSSLLSTDDMATSADVIYDGGLEDKDNELEYKVIFDNETDAVGPNGNDVEIDVRGVKYKIPYAIECHLCNEMMNLCLRRTRYRGEQREYPAYRCNRKGCQTFRSIRKVFSNCTSSGGHVGEASYMVYDPSIEMPKRDPKPVSRGEFSESDDDEFVVQRVYLPKVDARNGEQSSFSVTDRLRKANQRRPTAFSEFSDQLRRDISANKRIRVRKQPLDVDEQQGTLFYISKELTPQEIIELQDAVIKTLIALRKIPPPMTMYDLPVFANCPYSKSSVEKGLARSQTEFWNAFTDSSQPPIPEGFIRRKDDTLIYKDPKPYRVPDILQENSPRKQADAVVNYQKRKIEQDARRMERRHVEKRYRSWASLKREFDMAEADERPESKASKMSNDDASTVNSSPMKRPSRQVSFQELVHKMDGTSLGQMTCRIRASESEHSDSMQWIDVKDSFKDGAGEQTKTSDGFEHGSGDQLDDEVFESEPNFKPASSVASSSNSFRPSTSPVIKSFSPLDNGLMKNSGSSQLFFPDSDLLNNNTGHNPSFYPFLPPYPSMDPTMLYSNTDEHYQGVGASEVVRSDPMCHSPFTYIHPISGMRLTDPSAYLNSFVPSPITKLAPMSFNDETLRPRRSSEPTTPSLYNLDEFNAVDDKNACMEENKDNFLKYDDTQ